MALTPPSTSPTVLNGQTYNIPVGTTAAFKNGYITLTNKQGESRSYNPSQLSSMLASNSAPKPTTPTTTTPTTTTPTATAAELDKLIMGLPTYGTAGIPRAPQTSDFKKADGSVDTAKYNAASSAYYTKYPYAFAEQYKASTGKDYVDPKTGQVVPTSAPVSIPQYMANTASNPTLGANQEFTPVLSNTSDAYLKQTGQTLTGQNAQLGAAPQVNAGTPMQAQQTSTAPVDMMNPQAAQYQATTVSGQTPQMTAEQMNVDPLSTVAGQLKKLYAESANGTIPEWAKGAAAATQEMLAARGMGNSSIGAAAITTAIQSSALNIAAQDAQTYFQKDLTNFNAKQQTALQNVQMRQQALLSDQAAENAAKNFNASSAAQVQQFQANMMMQINEANAQRLQLTDQFNREKEFAAQQFNAQTSFERQKFNSEMQFAIEQSNVLWRRTLNTENTAAVNAANMANTMNRFQLSTTALNNLWQQYRDEASWAFSASENEKNRAYNIAQLANNQSYINSQKPSLAEAAGSFAIGLLLGK